MQPSRDWTQHVGAPGKARQRWGTQTGAQTDSDGRSGCLNHPCLPPRCQNPGEVSQAQLHQYWVAKS